MDRHGNIVVSWPYDEQFDFESAWPPIRELISNHGFDHRAVISGSFIMFHGTKESASELKSIIAERDSEFEIRWEPANQS